MLNAKAALEAFRNEATAAKLGGEISAVPEPDLRLEEAAARRRGCSFLRQDRQGASWEAEVREFYAKIGQPTVGLGVFVTKVRAMNRAERAAMIALCADLSMRQQCALIGLALRGL